MAASDIDFFIREQKSKLARQRQQIRSISPRHQVESEAVQTVNFKENIPPTAPRLQPRRNSEDDYRDTKPRLDRQRTASEELPLVARMVEGELQHHKFEQQRRQEIGSLMRGNRQGDRGGDHLNPQREDEDAVFIRDHGSARKRSQVVRNQEYNDFKRQEEEKFKNRFAQKKPPAEDHISRKSEFISPRRPPQQAFVEEKRRPAPPQQQPRHRQYQEPVMERPPRQFQEEAIIDDRQRMYREKSKIDELDRKVQELRQHKIPDRYDPQAPPDENGYEPSYYPSDNRTQQAPPTRPRRIEVIEDMLDSVPYGGQANRDPGYSLPINEHSSEEMRKREERNREYNEFLREKEVKDLSFAAEKRGWGSPVYDDILMRKRLEERHYRKYDDPDYFPVERKTTSLPKTKLTSMLDSAEQQLRDLDTRYDKSKVKFARRDQVGGGPTRKPKGIMDDDDFLGMAALDDIDKLPAPGRRYEGGRSFPRATIREDDDDLSGLPIGRLNGDEIRRKKERYADDLRRQMEEQKHARKKELDDRRSPGPTDLNRSKSANDILAGYAGGPSATRATDKLAGLPAYNTPADDAYFYYAAKDPLEDSGGGGGFGDSMGRSHSQPGDASRRVRFNNDKPTEGMMFDSQEDRKLKQKEQRSEYANELQRQMVETKRKQELKKREQMEYDRKKDEEIANYNPFGKGGGGAPLKDAEGNLITNLHLLQHGTTTTGSARGNTSYRAPHENLSRHSHEHLSHSHNHDLHLNFHGHHHHSSYSPPPPLGSATGVGSARTPRQTNVHGESTHARGGHGIFGIALSEEEKVKSEKYKDELRIQIEEKRREAEYKKQQQRELEDREQKKLDDQQRRIQSEYEEEIRKKREKEEEARRANDEARKQAEDRRKELERQKEEDTNKIVTSNNAFVDHREPSPIITVGERGRSPVLPALELTRRPSEGGHQVMNQLASMRRQLDAERAKVESALAEQRNHVEVYDPRLQQTNEIVVHGIKDPHPGSSDVDVFEMVRNRQGPVPVRRAPSRIDTASDQVEQFRRLKQQHASRHHGGVTGTPITNSTLEEQQAALIREQESEMRRGKRPIEQSEYANRMPGMNPRDLGMAPSTEDSNQLQSESAYLGIHGSTFEADPDTGRPAYDIARFETPAFLRQNGDILEDSSTLDVDELAKKNEERLRKLQRMQSDTVSLNDPEEVLNRFMDRQMTGKNERPPSHSKTPAGYASRGGSQRTLVDESWLDPAGRSS